MDSLSIAASVIARSGWILTTKAHLMHRALFSGARGDEEFFEREVCRLNIIPYAASAIITSKTQAKNTSFLYSILDDR